MRSRRVTVALALAAVPVLVGAQDEPAAVRTPGSTASVVLTPQGVQRQTAGKASANPTKIDTGQRPLLPARPTLVDVVTSLACTSMFARRPDTQGTDPVASAGR